MDKSSYIDENDLPFTENELFRAFALTNDEQVARDAAHMLAELLSSGTYEGAWSIGYEGFAALALLSDDLRERVDAYILPGWENMRPSLIRDALRREGLPPGSEPTAPRYCPSTTATPTNAAVPCTRTVTACRIRGKRSLV